MLCSSSSSSGVVGVRSWFVVLTSFLESPFAPITPRFQIGKCLLETSFCPCSFDTDAIIPIKHNDTRAIPKSSTFLSFDRPEDDVAVLLCNFFRVSEDLLEPFQDARQAIDNDEEGAAGLQNMVRALHKLHQYFPAKMRRRISQNRFKA